MTGAVGDPLGTIAGVFIISIINNMLNPVSYTHLGERILGRILSSNNLIRNHYHGEWLAVPFHLLYQESRDKSPAGVALHRAQIFSGNDGLAHVLDAVDGHNGDFTRRQPCCLDGLEGLSLIHISTSWTRFFRIYSEENRM